MKKDPRQLALYARFLDFKPRKGDLRKIEILEAAIDCLSDDGIHHTTFESVGKRLGIGRAHVAYHFPELGDLIEAAIKFCVSHVQVLTVDAVSAEESNEDKLEAFITATFEWVQRFPQQASAILLLYYLASIDRRFKKLHDEVRKLGAKRIQAMIEGCVSRKNKSKSELLARRTQAILTGNIVEFLTTQPKESLEALRRRTISEVTELCDLLPSKS